MPPLFGLYSEPSKSRSWRKRFKAKRNRTGSHMLATSLLRRNQLLRHGRSFLAVSWERAKAFLLPSVSDIWLTILRVGLGLQVLIYCWWLRKDWIELFAANSGAIDRGLM